MNKYSLLVVTGVLGLPLAGAQVVAELSPGVLAPAAETAKGKVKSVDEKAKNFVITVVDKDVTVRWDDKTQYFLDGAASTRDKVVKMGNDVTVTHDLNLATKVEAVTKKP